MIHQVRKIVDEEIKREIAAEILKDLHEWFGIPKYTQEYIENSKKMPFFCLYLDNHPIGFISLKETAKYTAEIYCMGLLKKYHRKGLGKELYRVFESYAKNCGYRLIQVKTVKYGIYSVYDLTNDFYQSLGFIELEVFEGLWDEWNPCQVLVKSIG